MVRSRADTSIRGLLSLTGASAEVLILIAYLVITRTSPAKESSLGVQMGNTHVFITDVVLLMLLVLTFLKRPGRFFLWMVDGSGAGTAGRSVWLLCVLSVFYFLVAFPRYHIFAVRDLAVFCYSIFFPLTYFALKDRADAVKLIRYIIYASVVVATPLLLQAVTGIDLGLWDTHTRGVVVGRVGSIQFVGGGDLGANLAFALSGLLAYVLLWPHSRLMHLWFALVLFLAMAEMAGRSTVVAVGLAGAASFVLLPMRYRIILAAAAASVIVAVLVVIALPSHIHNVQFLRNFYIGMVSAAGGHTDPDTTFRLVRWFYVFRLWLAHPILGVGFGVPILPSWYLIGSEKDGLFNAGLPHNTYLTVMARMGIVGLVLVLFPMVWTLYRVLRAGAGRPPADNLAVANAIVAMAALAIFNPFFERPLLSVPFWIVLASAARLADTTPTMVSSRRRVAGKSVATCGA